MRMLDQRLQVLVTREQRRRLEEEARRTGSSVGAVIREAVERRYGEISRGRRIAAAAKIAGLSGRPISLDEMEAVLDVRFDAAAPVRAEPE